MTSQSRLYEYALDVLAEANIDQSVKDSIENAHENIKNTLDQERKLYLDLANSQPTGVYRCRVKNMTRNNEEKWRSLTDSPFVVEFANTRFCEILNIGIEAYQKNPAIINSFIFEPDKENFIQKNIESDRDLTPFIWEGRMLIRNKIIWGHFESTPRPMPNGDVIWTGVLFDVTKRKKEHQKMQSMNEELKIANAEKNKLFSIIAHDLKSPFNAIVGFSKLLVDEIKLKNIDELERYAEIVLDSSTSALDLLTNLMEWARSQTGHIVFGPESFNMQNLIKETVNVFFHIAKEKNITIEIDTDANIPLNADISMVSTILRNLISNAIKFTHKGGRVVVRAEQMSHHLKVIISDDGVGISESEISKVFKIDEKHSTRGTADEEGTGLGLILCKDFVERHSGQIWVESAVGKGSSFIFTLKNKVN